MSRDRTNPQPPDAPCAAAIDANGGLDRRALLAAAGSAVVAGLGTPVPGAAQAATAARAASGRIDAHTHFSSLRFLDALEKRDGKPFVLSGMYRSKPALTDAKARLAILDHNEIDIHVLVPVPWLEAFPRIANDRALAPQFARIINDEIAAVVAAQPKRFKGVALLPSVDPDAMVAEFHRAVKELGFVGAYMPVGPTAKRIDHPDYEALYRTIVELESMLWLHPSRPPLPDYVDEKISMYQEWQQIGWPHDTTSAMYRIVFSGVFERYPGIRIITADSFRIMRRG
jgi:predicted TIM-barrel fold metal-dependent hydrolase